MGAMFQRYATEFQSRYPLLTYRSLSKGANKQGLSASEWATAVAGVVGGAAGGKGSTSVGNGTKPEKVDEGVEAATKYLQNFHL